MVDSEARSAEGDKAAGATDASGFKGAAIQGGSHKEDHAARTQQSRPMSPPVRGRVGEERGCWKGDAEAGEGLKRVQGQRLGLEWEGRREDIGGRGLGPQEDSAPTPPDLQLR